MFGTEDLVFVPEEGALILDDVYHWRRVRIDVRQIGLRIRSTAFEEIVDRVRGALKLMEKSERHRAEWGRLNSHADAVLRDLAPLSGSGDIVYTGVLATETGADHATWWVRISDKPAESFFPEDYDRPLTTATGNFTGFQTFGSVNLDGLEGLEVALAGDDEDGMPFTLEVPAKALTVGPMPTSEALPLVREFCGVHGVSAHGCTVNVDARGDVAASHQFCTPLGRISECLYATLYVHYAIKPGPAIMGRIPDARVLEVAAMLERSHFKMIGEGPTHRIYEREGDFIHLYSGLQGRESENQAVVPSLLVVAAADGVHDIEPRSDLFEAIREAMKG